MENIDTERLRTVSRDKLIERLDHCATCRHRTGIECRRSKDVPFLSIKACIAESICPAGKWAGSPSEVKPIKFITSGVCQSKRPKIAFLLHDMAMGGIARYTASLMATLCSGAGGFDATGVVFRMGHHFDAEVAYDLRRYCPVTGADPLEGTARLYQNCDAVVHDVSVEAYQKVIDAADIISVAGLHADYASLPHGVDFRGKPVVTQIHGVCGWTRKVVEYMLPHTTHYVAVSNVCKRAMAPHVGDKEIDVIEFGIDLNRLVSSNDCYNARRKLMETATHALDLDLNTVMADSPWILYFGRFAPEKGMSKTAEVVENLIERARRGDLPLHPRHLRRLENAVAVYCGDGWDRKNQIAFVNEVLPHRSIILPWQRVGDVLVASDALMSLSEAEGGPFTVVEALACGMPVLSTPVGLIPELTAKFPQGATRLMCTPCGMSEEPYKIAEKLAWQLAQRKTGERMPDDWIVAQQTARRFNLHRFGEDWGKLLRELMA